MFGRSVRIGKLFGINLTVNWSLLLLVAVMSVYLAVSSGNLLAGMIVGPLMMVLLFASILAHELGHSLVAQRLGVRIQEIELHFFGGAAKMLSAPRTPRDEILIAAAGPAVSFALAGVFWLVGQAGAGLLGLTGFLALANLLLGGFNLIPALPTDGGRILRGALSHWYHPLRATRAAIKVARVATIALAFYFLVSLNFFGVALAVFLWILGTQELRMAEALNAAGRSPYGYGHGFASYPASSVHAPASSAHAPSIEVFDRDGRFIGTAPGGYEPAGASTDSAPEPRAAWAWGAQGSRPQGAPAGFAPFMSPRRYVVRGADGRLWVVTENRSSW